MPSLLALMTSAPSSLNCTRVTQPECPVRVHSCQSHSIQTRPTPKNGCKHLQKARNSSYHLVHLQGLHTSAPVSEIQI